jgi:hypothetical protein
MLLLFGLALGFAERTQFRYRDDWGVNMLRVTKSRFLMATGLALFMAGLVWAAVSTIPASSLIPSTGLYTDSIGGGIGNSVLARNDDGYTGAIDLGFTLNFYGSSYTQFFINNNGDVTFQTGYSSYVPEGPQGASVPVISLFFSDVDTRASQSGLVYLRNDIPNQLIVTWDHVGYYSGHGDKLNTFQLVLRGPNYTIPSGEGAVGFFYTGMQWESADTQGGSGGFCSSGESCKPAAAGFGDGQSNGVTIAGSIAPGIANTLQNHHIWFDLAGGIPTETGGPATVPVVGTVGLVGLGIVLAAAALLLRRRESHAA